MNQCLFVSSFYTFLYICCHVSVLLMTLHRAVCLYDETSNKHDWTSKWTSKGKSHVCRQRCGRKLDTIGQHEQASEAPLLYWSLTPVNEEMICQWVEDYQCLGEAIAGRGQTYGNSNVLMVSDSADNCYTLTDSHMSYLSALQVISKDSVKCMHVCLMMLIS